MAEIADIKVSVKLKANPRAHGPSDPGAVEFSYEPGEGALALGADIASNGDIDLTRVHSEARLQFEIVEPHASNPILKWDSGEYTVRLRSNKGNFPERDSLLLGKCPKPTNSNQLPAYPLSGKEFIAFYYSGNDNRSVHVQTRNTDKSAPYWYALGVNLRKSGETDPNKDIVCRHDPQIKNGGNRGIALGQLWLVATTIILVNVLAVILVHLFVRPF
jgi:hypothetical protein